MSATASTTTTVLPRTPSPPKYSLHHRAPAPAPAPAPTPACEQEVIVSERRFQYEEEVRANPLNYDGWFDYIRLEESAGDIERTREVGVLAPGCQAAGCRLQRLCCNCLPSSLSYGAGLNCRASPTCTHTFMHP